MLTFNSILLFSANPKKLQEFYEKVFAVKPDWSEGDWAGYQLGMGHIMIGSHEKVKGKNTTPERMLINLETKDVQKEFTRIEKLGAKVIAKPYHPMEASDMWIATLADIDGNYFQLASPMK